MHDQRLREERLHKPAGVKERGGVGLVSCRAGKAGGQVGGRGDQVREEVTVEEIHHQEEGRVIKDGA